MTNEQEMLRQIRMNYSDVGILDYEESAKRCYVRFVSRSSMYVAEKTKAPGTQIIFYKWDRSVIDYD